ncbi:MAG: nicotinamide riboside transporter PnuC [Gammaproteobacteria bacterium]|nr:nicotinamide riboside transporter PnuC [Gammaproteobacteria bacterium]
MVVASFISLETLAVIAAIAYLVLAIRQNIWCWAAALVSTVIYLHVFYVARLYMESGLQVFYIAMAVYGWYQWSRGDHGHELRVSRWKGSKHIVAITVIIGLSVLSTVVLTRFTNAAMPLLDSITTWGSVVATYMVARKVFENWHYWFVIDSLSIYLYISRDLHQTAMLFGVYLVLIVIGFMTWRKDLLPQRDDLQATNDLNNLSSR